MRLAIIIFIFLLINLILIEILKRKNKISNNIFSIIRIILIVIILEISIFQIKSYSMFFGYYQRKEFEYVVDYQKENGVVISYQRPEVNLEDLNLDVATIYLDIEDVDLEEQYDYYIYYSDDTTQQRNLPLKTYSEKIDNSKYTAVYLSGQVKNLRIQFFDNSLIGKNIKIVLNEQIPVQINIVRIAFLIAIGLLIYFLKNAKIFKENYEEENSLQRIILAGIYLFAVLAILYFTIGHYSESQGDLYNKLFVEALANKQFSLLEIPSEKLLNLENPYDEVERRSIQRGIDYIWDAALFQGKYYVYFGILPALILFLPYYLITQTFLDTYIGVMIFAILSILLLSLIFRKVLKMFFKEIPFKLVVCLQATLLFGSGVIWMCVLPRFYEVVSIAGLYFALQGVYFLLNVIESKNKIQYKSLFASSLFLALAVACRPTQLLTSLLMVPVLIRIFKYQISNKKDILKLVLSLLPYLIIGILLMAYNYVRFGNILEFGSSYQLTINDMRNLKHRFMTIPIGLICNLFTVPIIQAKFPFVFVNETILDFFGYYYVEEMFAGVFVLSPIALTIFFIKKIWKKSENKEHLKFAIWLAIVGFIICVISIAMAGSNQRYLLDYSWMFVLAGIICLMQIFKIMKSKESQNIIQKVIIILTIYTVVLSLFSGFLYISNYNNFLDVEYDICFWK